MDGNKKPPEPGGLAARLRRITAEGAFDAKVAQREGQKPLPVRAAPLKPAAPPAGSALPRNWEHVDEYVWKRRTVVQSVCPVLLPPSPLLPSGGRAEDFVFYDIETTGLSGGAGTLAFLVGVGVSDGRRLVIDQFFLRDYPGESGFLSALLGCMGTGKTYVSYNGKAFDTQILRTRCIMNGYVVPVRKQLDLLYPVRRLYGAVLPSCTLSSVEEHVLRARREADIPGALIPEVYFEFLKTGETTAMEQVFDHHFRDIVSLERLLAHIAQVLADPDADDFADRCGLGRWLIDSGFPAGTDILARAFEGGDFAAGSHLARYLKRTRDFERAVSVWTAMFEQSMDLHAAFELAKYAEHKLRNYSLAGNYASIILGAVKEVPVLNGPESREALEHRLKRIRKKAGSNHHP